MKITRGRLKELIKEELEASQVKEEYDDMLDRPASQREHMGDAIADVMWDAVKGYLMEMGMSEKQLYAAELEIEDQLTDIAVKLSHFVGGEKKLPDEEMMERRKIKETSEAGEDINDVKTFLSNASKSVVKGLDDFIQAEYIAGMDSQVYEATKRYEEKAYKMLKQEVMQKGNYSGIEQDLDELIIKIREVVGSIAGESI